MSGKGRVALLVTLALAGIAARAVTMLRLPAVDLCGADFPVFYASGKLVGTPDLYTAAAVQRIQLREMACTTPSALFIRLPYFAAWMWPWARLPFWPSFALWRAANVLAIAVFIWLWPAPREWTLLTCAWSLPLGYAITNGQDVGFLLMWLAIGFVLLRRETADSAGLAFSMCAAKFHLFLLFPLQALGGLHRMLLGLLGGGAALLAVCFAVQGAAWPAEFLAAATNSRIDPHPHLLFNIRGLAHGSMAAEVCGSALVGLAALYVFRYGDAGYRLSAALTGGLLLSHHLTISDAALLIPVALILAFHVNAGISRLVAIFLVTPVAYFLIMTPRTADVPRLLLLVLMILLAWEVKRQTIPAIAQRNS